MTPEEFVSKLADVMDTDAKLNLSTKLADVEDWDSLSHIRLIAALEKHFNLKFNFRELQDLNEVGDMVDLIAKKLNG